MSNVSPAIQWAKHHAVMLVRVRRRAMTMVRRWVIRSVPPALWRERLRVGCREEQPRVDEPLYDQKRYKIPVLCQGDQSLHSDDLLRATKAVVVLLPGSAG